MPETICMVYYSFSGFCFPILTQQTIFFSPRFEVQFFTLTVWQQRGRVSLANYELDND